MSWSALDSQGNECDRESKSGTAREDGGKVDKLEGTRILMRDTRHTRSCYCTVPRAWMWDGMWDGEAEMDGELERVLCLECCAR